MWKANYVVCLWSCASLRVIRSFNSAIEFMLSFLPIIHLFNSAIQFLFFREMTKEKQRNSIQLFVAKRFVNTVLEVCWIHVCVQVGAIKRCRKKSTLSDHHFVRVLLTIDNVFRISECVSNDVISGFNDFH